jgi:tRNA threonylcarbamoyladenosine biosynthesis protein TsaB
MLSLVIRTDQPEAELGLYKDGAKLDYLNWQAHRELSCTIHIKIKEILTSNNLSLKDLEGIVVFKGPGSFTGLRIGISVANAFAYGLHIPIVSTTGTKWIDDGIAKLKSGDNEEIALPHYGADPHVTVQKK